MSSVDAPFGLRPVNHPSGEIRINSLAGGITSGYGTAIYSGTPIKWGTSGNIIVTTTGADSCAGVFAGCQYTTAQRRVVSPYWPASQTYDTGSMIAQYTSDPDIIYEGQCDGSVAQTANFEGINLVDASTGSIYTGQSLQHLNHTTVGATTATFTVVNIAPYPDNDWGDTYTIVRVKIQTYAPAVA